MRRKSIKVVVLLATAGTMLQFGGCIGQLGRQALIGGARAIGADAVNIVTGGATGLLGLVGLGGTTTTG